MENGKWLIGDPAGKEGTSTMQGTIRESSFASNPKNILKENLTIKIFVSILSGF
jgi:hypothetical protein